MAESSGVTNHKRRKFLIILGFIQGKDSQAKAEVQLL